MSKNALITGSSHGIGAATAIALAKEGYNVGITYCKNPEGAKEIRQQCLSYGVEAKIYGADFQVREDCEKLMENFLTSALLMCWSITQAAHCRSLPANLRTYPWTTGTSRSR